MKLWSDKSHSNAFTFFNGSRISPRGTTTSWTSHLSYWRELVFCNSSWIQQKCKERCRKFSLQLCKRNFIQLREFNVGDGKMHVHDYFLSITLTLFFFHSCLFSLLFQSTYKKRGLWKRVISLGNKLIGPN